MSADDFYRTSEAPGLHIATIAHEGQLWDAYLAFDEAPHEPQRYRARVRFNQAGVAGDPTVTQTTVIIIEESYEDAIAKARGLDNRQLQGLLRSSLPNSG
jgi:hypothetical protein